MLGFVRTPRSEAAFMYASQGAFMQKVVTLITRPAWREKPTYAVIATHDKSIAPEIQRNMYKRSNTKVKEVEASHVAYISQPAAVAEVIVERRRMPFNKI